MSTLDSLLSAIAQAARQETQHTVVDEDPTVTGANEFLFFIKPELLLAEADLETRALLEMIFTKIEDFGLGVRSLRVLSATYLARHGIIAQHYGVINRLATDAVDAMSEDAKTRFETLFGESVEEAAALGGLAFLEEFPQFTAFALDALWQNGEVQKLAGGTYALRLSIDGETVYLVNGFHPRQLEHFTASDRSIVVASLAGDVDWSKARNALIGKTNPQDAAIGSIRRTLLDEAQTFGLQAVNASWNGVHLSAGPIEGLVELMRYQTDWNSGSPLGPADFAFGQQLIAALGEERSRVLLTNPDLENEGKTISVFDLTEEKNADEVIALLRSLG